MTKEDRSMILLILSGRRIPSVFALILILALTFISSFSYFNVYKNAWNRSRDCYFCVRNPTLQLKRASCFTFFCWIFLMMHLFFVILAHECTTSTSSYLSVDRKMKQNYLDWIEMKCGFQMKQKEREKGREHLYIILHLMRMGV